MLNYAPMSPNTHHSAAPILDGHTHAFPDAIAARAVQTLAAGAKWHAVRSWHDGTVAGLLASMDRAGIHRTLMCSIATRPGQVTKITDWSAAIASDRVVPFASIHPDYEQPEAEIERIASLGCGAEVPPAISGMPGRRPARGPHRGRPRHHNLAMVFHAGYDLAFAKSDIASPQRIRNLFEAVPGLRLQACHLGGWQDWEESLRHIVGQPIYMETSFCLGQCPPDLLRRIIEQHPPELLMFGTDAPWADQSAELEMFKTLPIGPVAMRQALWENGCRFAGIRA